MLGNQSSMTGKVVLFKQEEEKLKQIIHADETNRFQLVCFRIVWRSFTTECNDMLLHGDTTQVKSIHH